MHSCRNIVSSAKTFGTLRTKNILIMVLVKVLVSRKSIIFNCNFIHLFAIHKAAEKAQTNFTFCYAIFCKKKNSMVVGSSRNTFSDTALSEIPNSFKASLRGILRTLSLLSALRCQSTPKICFSAKLHTALSRWTLIPVSGFQSRSKNQPKLLSHEVIHKSDRSSLQKHNGQPSYRKITKSFIFWALIIPFDLYMSTILDAF